MNFESVDDLQRTIWRSWFITPSEELNNQSPNICCGTAEGKAKIVSLLKRGDFCPMPAGENQRPNSLSYSLFLFPDNKMIYLQNNR
jgi:hypothetical protein